MKVKILEAGLKMGELTLKKGKIYNLPGYDARQLMQRGLAKDVNGNKSSGSESTPSD